MKTLYEPALRRAIRTPLTFIGALVLLIMAGLLFTQLGQVFIPTLDEKNIIMNALRIPSTSLSQSQVMTLMIEKVIRRFPQVAVVFSKIGTAEAAMDPMPPNSSDTLIMLKPREEWPDPTHTKAELQQQIEEAVGALAGNAYEFSQPIQMRFNELIAGVRGDVSVKVFGEEFEPMFRVANQIAAILHGTQGAEDVKVEQLTGQPVLMIKIDKAGIARLGLSVSAVQDVIGAAIGGREAGVVFEGDRRFPIVVRLGDEVRENLEALKNLPVPLPPLGQTGRSPAILLKQVARFDLIEGPNQISRENGKRRVVVTANVRGRDIGSLAAEVQEKVGQKIELPVGYWLKWGGQFENLEAARQRLMIVVPGCFFLIFLLLYTALGSPRDALLVFSAVPLALTGGIFALWLRGMPFSVSAAVGFIALSGVAVLNGLVMLTFIKQLIEEGTPFFPAIFKGAVTRLRPVAMTALVASLGFVPMALATGTGAEVQKPLATVVIGGLIRATLLTLLVLPALYARFGKYTPTGSAAVIPKRKPPQGAPIELAARHDRREGSV